MLRISATSLGKEFNYHWIFRKMNFDFAAPACIGLQGPNGSGKSTLLQIIAGFQSPSEGNIQWFLEGQALKATEVYRHISVAAPYMVLPEELTFGELVSFHARFKGFVSEREEVIALSGLSNKADELIKNFSSGMKQRVRLTLALLSGSEMVLLDEPRTNLDRKGIEWLDKLLEGLLKDRLVLIASNESEDFQRTKALINLQPHPSHL